MDLKANKKLNNLTPAEMDDLWMPVLVFSNTKSKQQANFKNLSSYATIEINEGTSKLTCFTDSQKKNTFHPKTNLGAMATPNSLDNLNNGNEYQGKDW